MRYAVETQFMHSWENCWREGACEANPEGTLITFATREEAEEAIKDHITDCINSVEAGDMEDSPDPSEFRVVEVIKDTPERIANLRTERVTYADAAVREYLSMKGEEHTMPLCDTDLSDLIADLHHLADSLKVDIKLMNERALMHYEAEKAEYEIKPARLPTRKHQSTNPATLLTVNKDSLNDQ